MAARIGALQVNQTEIALKADVVAALPVGTSVMWTGDEADLPSGFMVEDGSAISRTTYSVLWGLYSEGGTVAGKNGNGNGTTTFNLADVQGLGVAGVGTQSLNGRTKTGPSDAYTKQEDQFHNHWHQDYAHNDDLSGGGPSTIYGKDSNGSNTILIPNGTKNPISDGSSGTPRTGSENRESRIGRYFIVRVG